MGVLQLFNADARGVVSTRVCPLPDCISADVRREINGEYSLNVQLPNGAAYLNEIRTGRAIKAQVDEAGHEQYFIIKRAPRSLSGGVSVYAEHQSYLYNGIMLGAGAANPEGQPAITFPAMRIYAVPSITDIAVWTYSRSNSLRVNFPERAAPMALSAALKDYLIAAAGGELIFDGIDVEYVDAMGSDNGAVYRYGTNLTEMAAEEVLEGYASGIYPFWGRLGDASKPMTTLDAKIYNFTGTYPLQVIAPVDFTDRWETQPSQADLQAAAAEYEALNAPTGIPASIKVARERIAGDVDVNLGDTVTVENVRWNLSAKRRVMALRIDPRRGRVTDVELGTIDPGFAGAVKNMK